jgi:hypothetical protein
MTDPYGDLGGRRDTWDDLFNPDPAQHDRHGCIDKTGPDDPPYPPDWTPQQRLAATGSRIRTGVRRAGGDPTLTMSPVEHPPGRPCISGTCGKPSTFGDYCAMHYVLHGAYSKRGPTAVPALSLADLFERTGDEIL